uniref:Uncharacterized protein n=1 Tax=Timema douglasi TaxID=61478 RepID=A0A7R8W1K2_TIMDO|nr:unnamed protein product [Timema douglasi]
MVGLLVSLCEDQVRPAPTEKWCYVDCPVDCEVTRWTLWNTSECLCGNTASTMMRYHNIVNRSNSSYYDFSKYDDEVPQYCELF